MTMSDREQALQEDPRAQPERVGGTQNPPAPGGGAAAPGAPAAQAHAPAEARGGGAGSKTLATEPGPGHDAEDDGEARVLEGDLDELVATAAQRDEYLALAQRTQADFENYRKRVARESAAAAERGVAKLAKELLPALDNLDRALDAAEEQDPLLEGVRLVRAELSAALARVGVESYDPAGEPFDPAHHEAMAQHPVEGAESGTVVEVYQPGYRLNGTVIRPARVVVAG
jgi:molecular chaperone GrpE